MNGAAWLVAVFVVGFAAALAGCDASPAEQAFDGPAPPGSRLPHLAADGQGQPVMSWVEPAGDGHRLAFSVLGEAGWNEPVIVAEGRGWFVNWADIPSVQPLSDDLWAAHWLLKQPGGMYAYDIALSLSTDGGRTWQAPFTPHRDGTPTEHGFVSLWPAAQADGTTAAGAVWLDGRHSLLDPSRADIEEPRTVLRSAVFDVSGETLSESEVDDLVCDCCQTDVAVTADGALVAYRDRSADEVRDIRVARRSPSGWQPLGTVGEDGWVISGCPVNGPAVAASGSEVVVAWYTEADGRRRVQTARKHAGDTVFSQPRVMDAGNSLGRVDVELLENGDAVVSWLEPGDQGLAWIMVGRVSRDGDVGEPLRLAVTEASRPAGFPRMIRHGPGVLLAWTRWRDGVPRVITARVAADDLPAWSRSAGS